MLKRLWLIFAQAVTVALAALFVIATLKPQWLQAAGWRGANGKPNSESCARPAACGGALLAVMLTTAGAAARAACEKPARSGGWDRASSSRPTACC